MTELTITLYHHGKPLEVTLPESSTLSDLSNHIADNFSIPASNQKFLISPKVGLKKPPFSDTDSAITIQSLKDKKITLLGSTSTEISSLAQTISRATAQVNRKPGPIKAATPSRTRDPKRQHDDATYTFHQIQPLQYLPNPQKSLDFLNKLANDPGIRAAMRLHKFSVGLLTEMNPAEHTTENSRTLGLNRNKGQVIELRLRTDRYDGYRDYKTIRRTLCHELAHNVWSEHDRNFHNLWNEIEKLVQKEDWTRGGRSISGESYYEPPPSDEEYFDHGGWTGGEFVLGRGAHNSGEITGLSQREILAKAAEERMKEHRDAERQARDEHPS